MVPKSHCEELPILSIIVMHAASRPRSSAAGSATLSGLAAIGWENRCQTVARPICEVERCGSCALEGAELASSTAATCGGAARIIAAVHAKCLVRVEHVAVGLYVERMMIARCSRLRA